MKQYYFYIGLFLFILIFPLSAQTWIFPSVRAQVETPVAVNPTNTNNFICAAITQLSDSRIGYYYTIDAGINWNGSDDISGAGAGDPVVAFDLDGVAYLLYQVRSDGKLYLHKSTDEGISWSSRITVANIGYNMLDKPWLAVSPVRNAEGYFNLYVSVTVFAFDAEIDPIPSSIQLYRSTNGGSSFSSVYYLMYSAQYYRHGSAVSVGPNGEVFLGWANLNTIQPRTEQIGMAWSGDQGNNFQDFNTVPTYQIGEKGAEDNFYIKSGLLRVISWPLLAVDTSPGSHRGKVYVIWSGRQTQNGSADVLLIKGTPTGGGVSWSNVIVVEGSTYEDWMAAPTVSPDGVLSILYYSSGNQVADPIHTFLKYSVNGGNSFTDFGEVGTAFTITPEASFMGDYHGLSAWIGKSFAFWAECRDHGSYNDRQVYFREIAMPQTIPSGYTLVEVDQVDEGNQSFGKIERWNQETYTKYTVPHTFLFQENNNEMLRAFQQFKNGTAQKYFQWVVGSSPSSIINHNPFNIESNQPPIKAEFKTAESGVTLQNYFIHGGSGGVFALKDPWWIYFDDPPYGLRNNGMNADFDTSEAPWYLSTEDEHLGIFLDQSGPPLWEPPYYSIRAPQQDITIIDKVITYDWESWIYDPQEIELQNPTSNTTAVVLKDVTATLTANLKGRRTSDTPPGHRLQ